MDAQSPAAKPTGRLLIVDDVLDNRIILGRCFKRRGYEVVEVESGAAALERLLAEAFDLVLLDVMMPDMDGLEVLARIRLTHSQAVLPVIMVTARAASENVVEALRAGANDYVTKPVDFAVAIARVETQLARKQAEDKAAEAARALAQLNSELEARIAARTHELTETNARLEAAVTEATAVSESLRERKEHISRMAFTDADTGLNNRLALQQALADVLERGERPVVCVLTLERFAQVRNAIGATLSHKLVVAVAERLRGLGCAAVARLTSSTLGFLTQAPTENEARTVLEGVVRAMRESFPVDGSAVDVTVAAGFAMAEPVGAEVLIERAWIALEQAIRDRRRTAAFDAETYGSPAHNLSLMSELLAALPDPQFNLAYQPKYDLRQGAVTGVEALSRWRHPTRGFVSPDLFVTMAEETGHIREMTEWVLNQAQADQAELDRLGHPLDMSVNLSGRLLTDDDFMDAVMARVGAWRGRLCLEITETAVIDNPQRAKRNIAALAEAGVCVSIDDYGSGLSSLAYLRDIRAHELKIDKTFVLQMDTDLRSALLVRSTIDMAHSLGLKVTAEGVETAATQAMLAGMGCDIAQGYFISEPLAMPDLLRFLQAPPTSSHARAA